MKAHWQYTAELGTKPRKKNYWAMLATYILASIITIEPLVSIKTTGEGSSNWRFAKQE